MGDLVNRNKAGGHHTHSEAQREREARRERDLRDFREAVNKGYRNRAIEERMKQ